MNKMNEQDLLKKYFGHTAFRYGQREIISSILNGRDCLGVMPTGAGKSMCYQIPALMLDGTTVVISPLISLMKDQVEALRQVGIPAAYINSSLTGAEYFSALDSVRSGECKILYAAPERLENEDFITLCADVKIPLAAIDEAHCVSQWGQDFRQSYLKITGFVSSLPRRPVVAAFTATATDIVKRDIEKILGLINPFKITTGFDRSNLYFEVRQMTASQKDSALLDILGKSENCCTIIYCSTRKNTDNVCDFLCENGFNAAKYHAGLSDLERRTAQENFIYDRVNIIVATNAFGMGIDKSNVSLVIHYNMPKDIESYYQEAGRAGRDGSPARCILLYSKSDVRTNKFLIEHGKEESGLSESEICAAKERDFERLKRMTFYSTTERCLREFILRYFGERTADFCGNCSSCLKNYNTIDITVQAQKILSCIFRMKQKNISASRELICATLNGSVENEDCKTLSTFGIMNGSEISEIGKIVDYLIEIGFIQPYGGALSLTDLADSFIKEKRTLLMKIPKEAVPRATVKTKETAVIENPELFAQLKELRKRLAAIQSVPAYVVFPDSSLREMSAKMPKSMEEFLDISGVGEKKAAQYGKKFLAAIAEYLSENE